jgi:DNA-binding MarR family transcriptional regulator
MKISNERMSILAKLNLLEIELPIEVMFPFEISNVHRFFNLAPLIHKKLMESIPELLGDIGLEAQDTYKKDKILQIPEGSRVLAPSDVDLSRKQLEILYYVVKHPGLSASKLSSIVPYSRHTISRVKEKLLEDGYLSCIRVPDLSKLNYSILSLFHAKIDPKNPLQPEMARNREILQEDSIFFVSRPTELIMLAAYENYVQYNRGMSSFNQFLKVNNYQRGIPTIRNHSLGEAIWIKRFQYHQLVKETFDLQVK